MAVLSSRQHVRWWPLLVGGRYDVRLREATKGRHGVYAFRDKTTGRVLYIGESHTGRLWKTAIRHVHGQSSFAAVNEWTHGAPAALDVAFWVTDSGDDAEDLESALIVEMEPLHNLQWADFDEAQFDGPDADIDDLDDAEGPFGRPTRENPHKGQSDKGRYQSLYARAIDLQRDLEAAHVQHLRTGSLDAAKVAAELFMRLQKTGNSLRKLRAAHGWNLPPLYLITREAGAAARAGALFGGAAKRPRKNPGIVPEALDDYEQTHWRQVGAFDATTATIPVVGRGETLVVMGALSAIEYETEKGDDGPSTYRHELENPLPQLCYVLDPKTGQRGGLIIAGGGYVVEDRGIVG